MAPQTQIRGYELIGCIGVGAGSIIYKARDLGSGQVVAIKRVSVEGRENQKYLRHAQNEYTMLRTLHKRASDRELKGVVKVCRLMRSGFLRRCKQSVLVMEYVEGLDLRRERRYPIGQIVDIMAQVSEVLSRLHGQGVIHGDLKPENIIISPKGRATLVDFGFSCRDGSMATSIRGTRDYMAPEQVNRGRLTAKTDIYNFGATVYFLLTGRHIPALIPAQGDNSHFIPSDGQNTPAPRSLNPKVPAVLDEIILRCVASEAIERPSYIDEVTEVLAEVRSSFLGS